MKRKRILHTLVTSLLILQLQPGLDTNAHSLTPWSQYYTPQNANSTNSFAIMDRSHVDGGTAYYSWMDNYSKTNLETALGYATNEWGMINNIESDTLTCYYISYNPNTASGAYGSTTMGAYGHYSPDTLQSIVTVFHRDNYQLEDKRNILIHELGHLWGICDLYNVNTNLPSIYSNTSVSPLPTRHDKNAMYIGQNRPWYYDDSNHLKFLKQPGTFAQDEWVYSVGFAPAATSMERIYVGSNESFVDCAFFKYGKTYGAYSIGSTLYANQILHKNQYLASSNGRFIAKMQDDGNFVVYNTDTMLWQTGTDYSGSGDRRLALQNDGNIVIYDSTNTALWNMWGEISSHLQAYRLIMQDDGNLVAYSANNSPVWYTNPHTSGTGTFNVVSISDIDSKLSTINSAINVGSTLITGQTLSANQYLSSPNKMFIAKLQYDGNFVIYNSDSSIWSSKTNNTGGGTNVLKVKNDGNIEMKPSINSNDVYWELWQYAGAWKDEATLLVLQNDGNLVAYSNNNTPIWWSGTSNEYGNSAFNIPVNKALP